MSSHSASSTVQPKLPKPLLRNLAKSHLAMHLCNSVVFSFIGGFLYYNYYVYPRHKKLEDFYANYDADAAFERMRKRGVFTSCPAD